MCSVHACAAKAAILSEAHSEGEDEALLPSSLLLPSFPPLQTSRAWWSGLVGRDLILAGGPSESPLKRPAPPSQFRNLVLWGEGG